MKMKEELLNIKEKLKKRIMPEYLQQLEQLSKSEDPLNFGTLNKAVDKIVEKVNHNEQSTKSIVLDDKVDEFIKWYKDKIVKENYTNIGEYYLPIEMRNFIEKMAVWYELRYPDYEINRIMYCSGQEPIQVSDEMFSQNNYINQEFDSDSLVRVLDWNEFYNTKAFINSLPYKEKSYFIKPKYPDIVYWNWGYSNAHLHLSKNGIVEMSEGMDVVIPGISNKEFEGKNIKEVVEMLKTKGIKIPDNNEFVKAIQDYDYRTYQKEEMLNCVMYRIIERGGNRIGPRRAFLFAKEFKRNIDIPMAYGVDYSDPGLRSFMNEYIKLGGSKDLVCYVNYFSKSRKYEKLNTVTINELIKKQCNNAISFYTPEEDELHQRLVNAMSKKIDLEELAKEQEKLKKDEVIQLRLQRKLEKSKINK